jgi:hypothetical protein
LIFQACGLSGTSGGSNTWNTATVLLANDETEVITGQYIPGTSLSGFTDAANWTTNRAATTITVAFEPPSSGLPEFVWMRGDH